MKRLFIVLCTVCCFAVSCETEEPPFFNIEGDGNLFLEFESNDTSKQTILFSTNCGWSATHSNEWIKVSPSSGNASLRQVVQIGVDVNETNRSRSGSITITPNDVNLLPTVITVTQKQKNALIVSTPTITLPQSGGVFSVQLKANIDYEYEIKADWIRSVQSRALTESTLRFEAETNPNLDKRVGEIIIKGGGFTETVTVTQAQTNHISLSTTEQNFGKEGGSFSVDVEHNVDYTVQISADWISQVQTRAVKTQTLNFAIAENTTYDDRSATITISGSGITETITVTQKQKNGIITDEDIMYISSSDGTFTIDIQTNVDIDVVIPVEAQSWLSQETTRALATEKLTFRVSKNEGTKRRNAIVQLKNGGTVYNEFTVAQNCATMEITYTSSDGKIVTPYATDVFGANIISNSYESGKGVIAFDGEVTSIGRSAFQDCTSLTSIIIPNSVTEIGWYAFYRCSGLISTTITDSVMKIGSSVFYGCDKLARVNVLISNLTNYCTANNMHNLSAPIHLIADGDEITELTIPNNVLDIGRGTFANCVGITSVTIPNSVTTIGASAFKSCTGLTDITIPNSVTDIEDQAFYGCSELSSITIPNSVTFIGNYAFSGCTGELIIDSNIVGTNYYYTNHPMSATYPGWSYGSRFTELTIGNNVSYIGENAFNDWSTLTSVTIPNSVSRIATGAFDGCTNITRLTIPDRTDISLANSFAKCKLTRCDIVISDLTKYCATVPNPAYLAGLPSFPYHLIIDGAEITELTIPDGVTTIREKAFYNCIGLTSVTTPNSVTAIGEYAFEGCTGLKRVTIPNSVTTIGDYAFKDCIGELMINSKLIEDSYGEDPLWSTDCNITKLTIGGDITQIGNAFEGCSSLISVSIPESVKAIGESAFESCTGLTDITIPNSVTTIGAAAFRLCNNLKNITISDNLTTIEAYTFEDCRNLTNVTIPNSVTEIEHSAFTNCRSLTNVTIPNGVKKIGDMAFYHCGNLISVTISESVTDIGQLAFSYCNIEELIINSKCIESSGQPSWINSCGDFSKLIIGGNVSKIGDYVFNGCNSLKSAVILGSVTSIGEQVFSGCSSLTNVTISDNVTTIGSGVFKNCDGLKNVNITISDLAKYCTANNQIKFGLPRNLFIDGVEITKLTIPDGVSTVGESALQNCTSLTSVTIPNSVTAIEDHAFQGCSVLTGVVIPKSVMAIGESAFESCTSLTSVTMPNSIAAIEDKTFYGCKALTGFVIPESVTMIGNSAFYGCYYLNSITIPQSVTEIKYGAFLNCGRLESVYCKPITPPVGSYGMFDDDVYIYVPRYSVNTYRTASGWSSYTSVIKGYDF